jgi:RHS repeat-associated protein
MVYEPTYAGGVLQLFITYIADYFPYGKVLREYVNTGSGPERFLTTQHERDKETGLDYRGARYYDADIARFLSLDPLAAKFPSWSSYNYVFSNPLIFTDPTGKSPNPPDWYENQYGQVEYFDGETQDRVWTSGIVYDENGDFQYGYTHEWNKINHVPNQEEASKNKNEFTLLPEINSDISTGVAIETTMVGTAADLTLKELGEKAAGRATLKTISTVSGAGGGVFSIVDNGIQSYNDFSQGNYVRGAVNTTQTAAYAVGTGLLFTPLAPVGAAILLWTTVSDFIQMGVETQTGTNY